MSDSLNTTNVEEWKDIPGYPGYQASSHGRIKSLRNRTEKILKPIVNKWHRGYFTVNPYVGGHGRPKFVHRLILEAFIGPCPENYVCCHNDGNPQNNHISNLRWDTSKNNSEDMKKHGTYQHGENCCRAKLTIGQVEEIRAIYPSSRYSQRSLGSLYGVSAATVNRIMNNVCWRNA
jgi:hypothetical protein